MGNSEGNGKINPGIREFIHEQFQRVVKQKDRRYLTLSEILEAHSHEDYPFDFRHLGVLWVCDHDHDGVFSLDNLEHFAAWIQVNLAFVQAYEFKSQLQAKTVAKMIELLQKKDGESSIVNWFVRLLLGQGRTKSMRGGTYIRIQNIKLIYEALNVKMMSDIDIQSFFLLVKRASEEMGNPIEEVKEGEEEDDFEEYIQISVCKEFIASFLKGSVKLLAEVGYTTAL